MNPKITAAGRWSALTEIAAKLVTPVTAMILARLLAPEAFGVVATVTMVVSFVEMFADAGFQKYLVQHEFSDNQHRDESTNVAFWTNLTISLFIWFVIVIIREPLAVMVGNPGLGRVIAIACVQLPITAFSSIQMALYRRDFNYKTLFLVRIVGIFIPFLVTIPLAILDFGYWSLIIGTICGNLTNAIILTVKSQWTPRLFYSLRILKEMISFSIWSLVEAISIWFTGWIDIFIIGSVLTPYYLGLYRTSLAMVGGILGIITASTTPILFAALSRLQNDKNAFEAMFFNAQKVVAYFVLPMGLGIYLYSDLATQILLGDQWKEASPIIGIWALTSVLMIVFGNYSSEVYRAKGRPRLSFLAQMLHLIILVPTCIISLKYGFWVLIYARAFIRLQFVLVHLVIMKIAIKFPVGKMFSNVGKPMLYSIIMCGFSLILKQIFSGLMWDLISIGLCIILYFGLMRFWSKDDLKRILRIFFKKDLG